MYFPEQSSLLKKAIESLKEAPLLVLGHRRPDGDSLGSQIGLTRALNTLGCNAKALLRDDIPAILKPFIDDTPFITQEDFLKLDSVDYKIVTVDCSNSEMVGHEIHPKIKDFALNIDHHISNPLFAKENLVNSKAAAAAQFIAGMLLDLEVELDLPAAQALYLGIMTDTGRFLFNSTSLTTFEIAAELTRLGVCPSYVGSLVYERQPLACLKLLHCFLGTLKTELDGRVGIGLITPDMYLTSGALPEHTEGFADYTVSIEGTDVGVFLEQKSDSTIKGSLRGKDSKYRLDLLAQKLNGGGHACAAGFKTAGTLDTFYPYFLDLLNTHLNTVN